MNDAKRFVLESYIEIYAEACISEHVLETLQAKEYARSTRERAWERIMKVLTEIQEAFEDLEMDLVEALDRENL